MFIIQISYKQPLAEIDKYLQAHREFLDYYYKQGLLIASGPMKPRTGGIIIAAMNDKAALEAILQKDPYQLADLAENQEARSRIQFNPISKLLNSPQ